MYIVTFVDQTPREPDADVFFGPTILVHNQELGEGQFFFTKEQAYRTVAELSKHYPDTEYQIQEVPSAD